MLLRFFTLVWLLGLLTACGSDSRSSSAGNSSQSGSTATMLTYNQALYVLDRGYLKVFDTSNSLALFRSVSIPGAETLYVYNGYLYVGGAFGVDIFDLTFPLTPVDVGMYQHVRSCDPIVVENDIGYVTLRSGGGCGRIGADQLDVLDVSDPTEPKILTSYPLANPFGLAKTPDFLAICRQQDGLTLVDVSDLQNISTLKSYPAIRCFDLLYSGNNLITTSSNGIGQFSIDGITLTNLSLIPIRGDRVRER